jgi:hypothetical protein
MKFTKLFLFVAVILLIAAPKKDPSRMGQPRQGDLTTQEKGN